MTADGDARSAAAGPGPAKSGEQDGGGMRERRVRPGLRALVDEMLTQIRSAASHEDAWSPEERRRAEADLARIMEQVRAEAVASREGAVPKDFHQERS